ncbi:hypothetical protein [Mycoplasmoides pirum]|uniref:hypothetical protein n=1 Tax=Mycoplasmoides pirum TaxID=2122 RepID=UPI000487A3D3|nr:hypothetical protein [Mycoplasmoides pirum]
MPWTNFADPDNIKIRGNDYKYTENAIFNSISPISFTSYHGVEFMENEFWDQLKPFVTTNKDGKHDYSKCIGKEIYSYDFISSSLNKEHAEDFSIGMNLTEHDKLESPLKESTVFKIKVSKDSKNLAYVSGFQLAHQENFLKVNNEWQIIFNIGSKFKIDNVYKEKNINVFEMTFLQ